MSSSPIAKILHLKNGDILDDQFKGVFETLTQNGVIGLPTETVYGLAGNAFNTEAVTKIFTIKERPSFDPLIVHVKKTLISVDELASAQIVDATRFTPSMKTIANDLIKAFWPGPLTIVMPKHAKIPDLVTSGLQQVGVRMPSHPVAQSLLAGVSFPLAAPSANRFGRISPTTAQHVMEELGDRILWIVDGGPCDIGLESTVIAIDDQKIWLLRPGKISSSDLEMATGVNVAKAPSEHEKASPGMLASHYAPRKKMYFIDAFSSFLENADLPRGQKFRGQKFGLLVVEGDGDRELRALRQLHLAPDQVIYLSKETNPSEVARNMFGSMRQLDSSHVDYLVCSAPQRNDGLWGAIWDRLRRASTAL